MSQVYLTKIERKTIFTRALIYVLIVFLVADFTITGPFWFNFIPWLFILGVIGKLKGIDKVLTTIIGGFTVFISSVIMQGGVNSQVLILTAVALINLISGIITGECIYQFVLEHRLVKYLKVSKKVLLIVLSCLLLIISTATIAYVSGNAISYAISRSKLDKYISETYPGLDYKIIKNEYSREVTGLYVYCVSIDGQEVWFSPINKETFKDANIDKRLSRLNENLDATLKKDIKKLFNEEYVVLQYTDLSAVYEYSKVLINPDSVTVYITANVEEEKRDMLYSELASIIPKLENINLNTEAKIAKVSLSINNAGLEIMSQDFSKVTKEYIVGGFEIEKLDD